MPMPAGMMRRLRDRNERRRWLAPPASTVVCMDSAVGSNDCRMVVLAILHSSSARLSSPVAALCHLSSRSVPLPPSSVISQLCSAHPSEPAQSLSLPVYISVVVFLEPSHAIRFHIHRRVRVWRQQRLAALDGHGLDPDTDDLLLLLARNTSDVCGIDSCYGQRQRQWEGTRDRHHRVRDERGDLRSDGGGIAGDGDGQWSRCDCRREEEQQCAERRRRNRGRRGRGCRAARVPGECAVRLVHAPLPSGRGGDMGSIRFGLKLTCRVARLIFAYSIKEASSSGSLHPGLRADLKPRSMLTFLRLCPFRLLACSAATFPTSSCTSDQTGTLSSFTRSLSAARRRCYRSCGIPRNSNAISSAPSRTAKRSPMVR